MDAGAAPARRGSHVGIVVWAAFGWLACLAGCGESADEMNQLKVSVEQCSKQVASYHAEVLEQREQIDRLKRDLQISDRKIQALAMQAARMEEKVAKLEQAAAQQGKGAAGQEKPAGKEGGEIRKTE